MNAFSYIFDRGRVSFQPRILLFLFLFACWCVLLGTSFAQPPNVVLLFSDDAGYADFGFMQSLTGQATEFKTPRLDALAQQSTVFSNAYVTAPVCAASRAGLLTGRYGSALGMEYNISNADDPRDGLPTSEVLITERFQSLGYQTGVVGKWHVGAEVAKQPHNQGVDEFYGILPGGRKYFGANTLASSAVRRDEAVVDWVNEVSFLGADPDPTQGRYLTDAFGDEAAKFISSNAGGAKPFFLYAPFTAPHSPFQAKQQDLAEFDTTSLTGNRKLIAAQTLALDRAVGNIIDRIDDPNGDGDTSDSVADNTIIVFLNDNGGTTNHDNGSLKGFKGSAWEGGIRTPMIIHGPGFLTGQFDHAVTAADIFPTLVAAAGGTMTTPTDGVDLRPHISQTATGPVHEAIFWRGGVNYWAVRKGDWKLVKGDSGSFPELYQLAADGTGEEIDLFSTNPEKVAELTEAFVDWEVKQPRPSSTTKRVFNQFDRFLYNHGSTASYWLWRLRNAWKNADAPGQTASLFREDSYANLVLIFHPRDNQDFVARNNVSRAAGLADSIAEDPNVEVPDGFREVVLNQLRFEGNFNGTTDRQGTLNGLPLMFTNSLNGTPPELHLGSTRDVGHAYTFRLENDLVLHDDLTITGNSELAYHLSGKIRDFSRSRSLTKQGQSTVVFEGYNTYSGSTKIQAGEIIVDGVNAAIDGSERVEVASAARLSLREGLIRTLTLDLSNGGQLDWTGGQLQVATVEGDLVNDGGRLILADMGLNTQINGSFQQNDGTLEVLIGGPTAGVEHGALTVSGDIQLGGTLQIALLQSYIPLAGTQFQLFSGNAITGSFSGILFQGDLPADLLWDVSHINDGTLGVSSRADFNTDGIVNGLDLDSWSSHFGMASGAEQSDGDANRDGRVDGADFLSWQRAFGSSSSLASDSLTAVPEPGSATGLIVLMFCATSFSARQRRSTIDNFSLQAASCFSNFFGNL